MTIEEIRELIHVVNESGIAELEVQRGDNRVRIRRTQRERHVGFSPAEVHMPAATAPVPTAPPHPVEPPPVSSTPPLPADNEMLVKSPIVGTFYESSSPGNPP